MSATEPEHIVQIRETVRKFIETEIPRVRAIEWDANDKIPRSLLKQMGNLGLTGITTPAKYDGYGRDIYGAMAVIEELSKRSIGAASLFIMAACYGAMNISESGSEDQKRTYLPAIVAGDCLFSYGLSEPDVGADLATVKTRARRDGDKIIVNGIKRWCTGATLTDNIFVLVRDADSDKKYANLNIIIVPIGTLGITITPLDVIGSRGVGTTDVILEDVKVPADNVLGGADQWNTGWNKLAGATLDIEKLEVAAMCLGNAEGALQDAWAYAQERKQFGMAISGHQAIRHRLASAKAKLYAARQTLYHATGLATENLPCGVESSMAKYMVSELAQEVCLYAQRVMGAYGCARGEGGDMERYVREALVFPIAGGSSEIQLNNIANRLGLAKK